MNDNIAVLLTDINNNMILLSGNNDEPEQWIELENHFEYLYTPDIKMYLTEDKNGKILHVYSISNIEKYKFSLLNYSTGNIISETCELKDLYSILKESDDCITDDNTGIVQLSLLDSSISIEEITKIGFRNAKKEIKITF
jgi:hypothetical protein